MFIVHVYDGFTESGEPTWQWIAFSGRSAALFALLAGVGLALSTKGLQRRGVSKRGVVQGVAVRAAIIAVIGFLLGGVNNPSPYPVYVILPFYALAFLAAVPFLWVRTLWLWASVGFFAVFGPVLVWMLSRVVPLSFDVNPSLIDAVTSPFETLGYVVVSGIYPVPIFIAFVLAGMGLARFDLSSTAISGKIFASGVVTALLGWVVSTAVVKAVDLPARLIDDLGLSVDDFDGTSLGYLLWQPIPFDGSAWTLLQRAPHSNTTFDLLIVGGSAVAILGLCLWVCRSAIAVHATLPLRAAGSMPLSAYAVHIVMISIAGYVLTPAPLTVLTIILIFGSAILIRTVAKHGPLEALTAWAAKPRGSSAPEPRLQSTDQE
jgi:hypothetical protein